MVCGEARFPSWTVIVPPDGNRIVILAVNELNSDPSDDECVLLKPPEYKLFVFPDDALDARFHTRSPVTVPLLTFNQPMIEPSQVF